MRGRGSRNIREEKIYSFLCYFINRFVFSTGFIAMIACECVLHLHSAHPFTRDVTQLYGWVCHGNDFVIDLIPQQSKPRETYQYSWI